MVFRESKIHYNSIEYEGGRKWQEKKYDRKLTDYGGPYRPS